MNIVFFGGFREFSEMYLDALNRADFKIVSDPNNADLGVIAYYGKIIPRSTLLLPRKGFINAHPSLLPRWRGPSPVQSTILAGDAITGVTIHCTTEKVDAGDILAQKEVLVDIQDTCLSLTGRLAREGSSLLVPTIERWLAGEIVPKKQNEIEATYTKLLKKIDGAIDWNRDAKYLERMIRAYYSWPGAYINVNNKLLKIIKGEVMSSPPSSKIGTIFKTSDGFPAIVCGKDALKLLVVQPESKKEMPGDAYLRGHQINLQAQQYLKED